MKKMYKSLIVLLIIIVGVISIIIYSNNDNTFSVDSEQYNIPDNYIIKSQSNSETNLINEKNNKMLKVNIQNKKLNEVFEEYYKKHQNDTITEENFTVNDIELKGLTLEKEGQNIHTNYYYEKNNKVYQIFSEDNNKTAITQLFNK